jgi:hypothetical protein
MFTYLSSKSIGLFAAQSYDLRRPNDLRRRLIALGLVVALVGLAALLYPATVPHLMHHAQHHGATHGTALCSWMCAAGEGVDGVAAPLAHRYDQVDRLEVLIGLNPDHPDLLSVSSRAPPSS